MSQKTPNMADQPTFFVSISNSGDVRRALLEASKASIQSLRKYEEFKAVRHEKLELMKMYNQLMKQISILSQRLKRELPDAGLKMAAPDTKKESSPDIKSAMPLPQKNEEIDQLEEELKMIERKLNSMAAK